MDRKLEVKRDLLTRSDDYMGPATVGVFREHGAYVIEDLSDLTRSGAVETMVERAGHVDILVANLSAPANLGKIGHTMDDETWQIMFDVMVHTLHRLCRAVLPQMSNPDISREADNDDVSAEVL